LPIIHLKNVFDLLSATELMQHIEGCAFNRRESQKIIYSSFYGYAMAVCDRYSGNNDDSLEIMNDGFLKIFREINHFKPAYADILNSFKGWVRKIMIYTAIDHYRKYHKHTHHITELKDNMPQLGTYENPAISKLSCEEIIRSVQLLSPAYRTVFNLFVIEGYSHDEIAQHLGISEGTSKSNLAKARVNLQKILFSHYQTRSIRNVV
jgi:RNA polymerase sigma factor (sigma-70 family)